jgi:flagellar hook-associated protein 2
MDISSLYGGSSSIDYMVERFMALEAQPKNELIAKRTGLENRKKTLSELDSILTKLKTKADRLNDTITDYFSAKKATSSDTAKISATAGFGAAAGNHSMSVQRLAVSDTRVSQQYNALDSSFTGYATDQTFTIEVAHPTDEDENNRVQLTVTVAAAEFQGTNEEVMAAIADAINVAMSDAVTADTVNNDEIVHASVVSEENGVTRLMLRSAQTGYNYRMDFGASSLLNDLQVNAAAQSAGTSGGYMTNVGTSVSTSELNAQFSLNGLTFYRDSNNVTDAIEGVTLQLYDTFAVDEKVTVTADVEAVRSEVQGFIDAYNAARDFLYKNTRLNPDTDERGALADDLIYRDIGYSLRNIMNDEVTGTASNVYTKLYNIGIEFDNDGKMSIKDSEKFTEALEANSVNLSDLFRGDTGIATNLSSYIDNFVKTGGTIDGSKNNIDSQITSVTSRIGFMNDLLSRKELQLRNEFSKLQEMMITFSNQQSFLGMFSYQQ